MRKLGALYPLWNQELFIKPHLDMVLPYVDRCVVLMQGGPLPNYKKEHGYSAKEDHTREIIKHYFPQVEIYESAFPWQTMDFSAPLYNEGLAMMQDCDIVFRFDPDMFFLEEDFQSFMHFVRSTDFDCYRINFSTNSINYYVTRDYDHGLVDAQEVDPLGVSPQKQFTGVLDYPIQKTVVFNGSGDDYKFHHFRGWNKPKSTPATWIDSEYAKNAFLQYSNNGEWYKCPEEIKQIMEDWITELENIWQKES